MSQSGSHQSHGSPGEISGVLQRPLTELKGVGAKMLIKLEQMGLTSIGDLLFHLPYRYQDRTRITPVGSLRPGMAVVVDVQVRASQVSFGRRRSLIVRVQDGSGTLTLRFFYFSAAQQQQMNQGQHLLCYGEVRNGPTGLEMVHPEYKSLSAHQQFEPEQELTPWYGTTEGIQQNRMRSLVSQALDFLPNLTDLVPQHILRQLNLPDLQTAIATLHRPHVNESMQLILDGQHPAQRRLAFEELLAHQLQMKIRKQQVQQEQAPLLQPIHQLGDRVCESLGFELTGAQKRVIGQIRQDLTHAYPMTRLVQGDVGAGKTLVALISGLQVVENGLQFALMAPTEILSEQHFVNIEQWVRPLGVNVVLLTGKLGKAQRAQVLDQIQSGHASIIVGTHALFQQEVRFHKLGFIVFDEQHRFGVAQRLALRQKAEPNPWIPHQLSMTATPIPRSLAQSMYADFDYSQIDELPPGRQAIQTSVVSQNRREEVIARVRKACQEGKQIYWVCTLVEESEELQCQAAEETLALLQQLLPEIRIGMVHGRLKATEKQSVMSRFKGHQLDLLVATTVIEVGVDVPNATVMIIENPERLGLSQLHQLRGRIGRGDQKSYCLLMYADPLSSVARQRLDIIRNSQDGFEIAEMDLKLRGPGEIMGIRQTGLQQFRVADLQRDMDLLPAIQSAADDILQNSAEIVMPLSQRWLNNQQKYASV